MDRPSTTSSSRAGPLRSRTGGRSMITAGVLVAPLGVALHKGGTSHLRAKRAGESSTSSISTPSKRPGSSSSADVHGSVRITVLAVCQATVRAAATREIDTDSRPRARPPQDRRVGQTRSGLDQSRGVLPPQASADSAGDASHTTISVGRHPTGACVRRHTIGPSQDIPLIPASATAVWGHLSPWA